MAYMLPITRIDHAIMVWLPSERQMAFRDSVRHPRPIDTMNSAAPLSSHHNCPRFPIHLKICPFLMFLCLSDSFVQL